MTKITEFGTTNDVAITVLVDNRADLIVKSTETIKRFTDEPLLAEHGFSALIDLKSAGVRILWDAGVTRIALMENMRRMEINPATIDKIALSHGHDDHTASVVDILSAIDVSPEPRRWEPGTSLEEILAWVDGRRIPIIAHPAAFRERWGFRDDGGKYGPVLPPPGDQWEALGAEIVLSEGPYKLEAGCWTTGAVPRTSFEKSGISAKMYYREEDSFQRDEIEDDQAIVINLKDKGLLVLSGCAHAGIVNTVNYARQISGVDKVWAVMGGFHLARASDEDIQRTINDLVKLEPALIVPSHCTGFNAICQFAKQMPDAFVLGLVGTEYLF
ncbi:MAG: MBL fold metallo-hydrolase [Anaerolineales bacterium]|nr:MBL fold metallo-hydrolase [Anaerolineales bacterium]